MDGRVYITGSLSIRGLVGGLEVTVTREATGNEDSDLDGYGDPSSNAFAQALRRAAMAHGLGRALWRK